MRCGLERILSPFRPPQKKILFSFPLVTTVTELKGRGVEFKGGIEDRGFGLVTRFMMPGDLSVQLYQPHYTKG